MNYRIIIIKQNLSKLERHYNFLTSWEQKFFDSVKNLDPIFFSIHQFNTLNDIANSILTTTEEKEEIE